MPGEHHNSQRDNNSCLQGNYYDGVKNFVLNSQRDNNSTDPNKRECYETVYQFHRTPFLFVEI